jgi:hypothetical protein
MTLEECVGKEVEITIIGMQRDELRTTGVIVYGECCGTNYFLRHTPTEQEWRWEGLYPIDAEEGYKYWALDFQQDTLPHRWYKDLKVVRPITPKMYIKKHKV